MARNELLEEILAAKFDLDQAAPQQKTLSQKRFNELLDQALCTSKVSRQALLAAINLRYVEYRRSRLRTERTMLAKKFMGPGS